METLGHSGAEPETGQRSDSGVWLLLLENNANFQFDYFNLSNFRILRRFLQFLYKLPEKLQFNFIIPVQNASVGVDSKKHIFRSPRSPSQDNHNRKKRARSEKPNHFSVYTIFTAINLFDDGNNFLWSLAFSILYLPYLEIITEGSRVWPNVSAWM